MSDMSLADVAAVTKGNDDGWGGGSAWVLIILFAIIFGMGGGGWGNSADTAAVTETALLQQSNISSLQDSVGRLSDQVSTQNMMISDGLCNLGYKSLEQTSQIARDQCSGFSAVTAAVNNAAFEAKNCCCETNRNIDQLRYEGALNTAAINANTTEQIQRVIDKVQENRISDMQNQINQLQLQSSLCGVVRYPMSTTYGAGVNPFYNQNCCC
jgi:type II secretory pathway pseudopilin PulG